MLIECWRGNEELQQGEYIRQLIKFIYLWIFIRYITISMKMLHSVNTIMRQCSSRIPDKVTFVHLYQSKILLYVSHAYHLYCIYHIRITCIDCIM